MPRSPGDSSSPLSAADVAAAEASYSATNAAGHPVTRVSTQSDSSVRDQHASGSLFGTTFNISANIVGAGILVLPQAFAHASLIMGVLLTILFMCLSLFASYTLSVACEYTQCYSQAQLLARVLVGSAPAAATSEEQQHSDGDGAEHGAAIAAQKQHQQKNSSLQAGTTLSDAAPAVLDGDLKSQELAPNASSSEEAALLDGPDAEYNKAAASADAALNHVNGAVDLLLAFTYTLYCVAYSRVCADSMSRTSKSLGFPAILHHDTIWLVITGACFLIASMRRVLAEMTLTSVIAIVTIALCIIAIIARFIGHPPELGPFYVNVNYFKVEPSILNAFGTLSSAYGYQVNHPAMYQELKVKSPASMQKPVIVSMVCICIVYCVTGVLGYLMFGEAVTSEEAGGDIMNNFPTDDTFVNVCRLGLFAHFVCVEPLVATAVKQCMHRVILRARGLHKRADNPDEIFTYPFPFMALEIVVITVTAVLVAAFLSIGVVINIAGMLGGLGSILIFPSIIGYYVYAELEQRLGTDGAGFGSDTREIAETVKDPNLNNFCGCCPSTFVSFRTLKYISIGLMILGPIIMVTGLIVVLQAL